MIKLENKANRTDYDASAKYVQQDVVTTGTEFAAAAADELLATQFSDVSTSTRITSRRITKTSRSISSGKQISFVQSSSVTATWSGSSPRIESLAINNDGHAVLGFDFFYKIPAGSDLFGWVNNLDALIKNQNVGLQKEQVRSNYSSATDSLCGYQVSAVHNCLNNEAGEKNDQYPTTSDSTTGSEFFNVGHLASFSQMGAIK